jgi:signal transduction histidine kinase/DNA-binding response OmpR family regulator
MPPTRQGPVTGDLASTLATSGVVGADLLAVNWKATPLGPMAAWPQSLQTAVRIVVSSRFSMWMAWGDDLTFFCNEAYRRDTLGVKYPWALGRPASEVWAEIWSDIGPRIEAVMGTGTATWDEALQLFLQRSGYVEETYHTFSYSPLTDDTGLLAGMLCVVTEDTGRVIDARRIATLRDLGLETGVAPREADMWSHAATALAANPQCLPFAAVYLFDDEGDGARLVCATGLPPDHPAAPERLTDGPSPWPWTEAAEGRPVLVGDLSAIPGLPTGAWKEPPRQALLLPLPAAGQPRPYGFLAAGLNRYRPLDDGYRDFLRLVAGQLAARLSAARAFETQRARADSLAELDRAKTAFFTNVSHEFRTPLTLLLGPAEDALADAEAPLPPVQRQRVEVIARNGQRLLKLVNSLLDFSRLEAADVDARFEPVDLASLTCDLVAMFESAIARGGLSLTLDCPPLTSPVYVDREMWAKIVLNLLSNALKFTFTGGIRVGLRAADGHVVLTVADTGIGIAPADQGRLFERFQRVTGAEGRTYEGSGIGLALVAELTALHGGSVAVCSAPGEGSTFTVTIPSGTQHLPADRVSAETVNSDDDLAQRQASGFVAEAMRWLGEREPTDAGLAPAPGDGRPRILVVDDNADVRRYVCTLLAPDYHVESASDGVEALACARRHVPDLVLTDVMMPKLDGFGLLSALRADPATMHVPVIMLSARAGDDGIVEGLDAGADDYLVKPFSARELTARVRANLELDRSRRAQDALQRGRDLLDQAQRLARLGSWELDLTTGVVVASDELLRLVHLSAAELADSDFMETLDTMVHPEDRPRVSATLQRAVGEGGPFGYEARLAVPEGDEMVVRVRGEALTADGRVVTLRGSIQDVTQERQTERAVAAAAAAQEVAAREHQIADELQATLLPRPTFEPDHLDVHSFYRAGVAGTQVGGDWYDVIELSAGRTALVIGDVMGRGVPAAAVMGQVRAAVRAYARLDLPPSEVLEYLDGVVSDLSVDHIVTCVYAVYDPHDRSLTYANAGHVPPFVLTPEGGCVRLTGAGPPLGSGPAVIPDHQSAGLPVGSRIVLYTDGLVERRDRDVSTGLRLLGERLAAYAGPLEGLAGEMVTDLLPEGPDDDVAILVAGVPDGTPAGISVSTRIDPEATSVPRARAFVSDTLRRWGIAGENADEIVLCGSELVTNAVLHGRPPIDLRMRLASRHLFLEVLDSGRLLPQKVTADPGDERGRGLHIVDHLAGRWGTRPTSRGKAVWCAFPLSSPVRPRRPG